DGRRQDQREAAPDRAGNEDEGHDPGSRHGRSRSWNVVAIRGNLAHPWDLRKDRRLAKMGPFATIDPRSLGLSCATRAGLAPALDPARGASPSPLPPSSSPQ